MNIIYGDDNSITINNNIDALNISNGRIIIDGQDMTNIINKNNEKKIITVNIKGNVKSIVSHARLSITGDVGSFESHGSAKVDGNIKGNVTSHGSLICGKIEGNITSFGSVMHS